MAKDYIKKVINVDIGIKVNNNIYKLIEINDFKEVFKDRLNFTNKGSFGYVGILGGSSHYPGAIRLAHLAQIALCSGCGVSKVIIPDCIYNLIFNSILEATISKIPSNDNAMMFDKKSIDDALFNLKALAIGVGWSKSEEYKKILEYILLNYNFPVLIDADGLNVLSKMNLKILNKSKSSIILTPHLKEFSRLTGYSIDYILENIIDVVLEFSNKYNVILLLKGPTTIIAKKDKIYFVNKGCSGMASAGSGDVLTGILIGMLGYMDDLFLATALAAYINGYAGELAQNKYCDISMTASDTISMIKQAIKNIKSEINF